MVPLSKLNETQVRVVFAKGDVAQAVRLISERSLSVSHASLLERIRSAAIRMSNGNLNKLREALALAEIDWRDLLVAAEFANDVDAHLRWIPSPAGSHH